MILVIDNYDSFVHNLARYFKQLGYETLVVRNDKITVAEIIELKPDAIVISPGPCTPDEAGCSLEVVKQLGGTTPILGICLGHQAIVQALGGKIVLANEPIHGRQSSLEHFDSTMFNQINNPFVAGRYHSLVANTTDFPDELTVAARADDGTIMAVQHKTLPMVGLQFHPESILTECGYRLLINFLKVAKLNSKIPAERESQLCEEQNQFGEASPLRSSRLSVRSPSDVVEAFVTEPKE